MSKKFALNCAHKDTMTSTTVAARHPWLEVFSTDPMKIYDQFIRGYDVPSPYQRADAPDVARMVFGPLAAGDPALMQLGIAITAWLDARFHEPIPVDGPRRQCQIREISECFEIIRLLEPGVALQWVHDNRTRLLEWTSRLVDSPARDARSAFLLTLNRRESRPLSM